LSSRLKKKLVVSSRFAANSRFSSFPRALLFRVSWDPPSLVPSFIHFVRPQRSFFGRSMRRAEISPTAQRDLERRDTFLRAISLQKHCRDTTVIAADTTCPSFASPATERHDAFWSLFFPGPYFEFLAILGFPRPTPSRIVQYGTVSFTSPPQSL